MRSQASATGKSESRPLSASDVLGRIRDLIVHLHRGNGAQAELIVAEVAGCLNGIMRSGADPGSFDMQRAQQTLFALDEVRILLAERDFEGAATAARDAATEWRQSPPEAIQK